MSKCAGIHRPVREGCSIEVQVALTVGNLVASCPFTDGLPAALVWSFLSVSLVLHPQDNTLKLMLRSLRRQVLHDGA